MTILSKWQNTLFVNSVGKICVGLSKLLVKGFENHASFKNSSTLANSLGEFSGVFLWKMKDNVYISENIGAMNFMAS
jgi:hypothetical protein